MSMQLSRTDAEIEALPAEDVLLWASEEFGDRLCLSCSWQKQSSVLVHMASELGLDVDVVELDTHLFFKETYETRERLVERYGLKLIRPEVITVAEQHKREGPNLWESQPGPLLPHPEGRAADRDAAPVRCLGLRHPARPVALAGDRPEGRALRAVRRLEDPAARRLERAGRLDVHHGERHSVQPAARRGLPLDRVHPLHAADPARRGGAGRPLGRVRQAGMRHSPGEERKA